MPLVLDLVTRTQVSEYCGGIPTGGKGGVSVRLEVLGNTIIIDINSDKFKIENTFIFTNDVVQ